jgi:hypothetical protein
MIRCDVNLIDGKEKFQMTGDTDDAEMVAIVNEAAEKLKAAGRGAEEDEVRKSLKRSPMTDWRTGHGQPSDMQSQE